MLILNRAWAPPALLTLACACSAPEPVDEFDPPVESPPVGCEPRREPRAATSSGDFSIVAQTWCEGCPFEDQASLVSSGVHGIEIHAGKTGKAALLANAGWQSGKVITLFDPSSGWSVPQKVPLGDDVSVSPGDSAPYFLSDWHGILRLREPDGVEENISCTEEGSLVPASVDVRDGTLHVVAGWRTDGEQRALLLTRPVDEPDAAWEHEYLGSFDQGPMQAERDADGSLILVGMRGADAVLVRDGEEVHVPVGVPAFEGDFIAEFEVVAGESFAAIVTQRPTSLEITFDDGDAMGFPAPNTVVNPNCDASTACGGRCDFRQHLVGRPAAFAAGRYLFVGYVDTTVDRTVLFEDVLCPESTTEICDCREVIERDESSSEVAFARFDPETLDGQRVFTADIPLVMSQTMRAQVLGDRVVFGLGSELEGETRLGTLPVSALLPSD